MTRKKIPISPARRRRMNNNACQLLQARVAPLTEESVQAHVEYYQRALEQMRLAPCSEVNADVMHTLARLAQEIDRRSHLKDSGGVITYARTATTILRQRGFAGTEVWTATECTAAELEAIDDLLVLFELQLRNNHAGLLNDATQALVQQARGAGEPLEEIDLEITA